MSMQSSTILEKMVTSCSLERPDMFGPPSVEAGGGSAPIGSSRVVSAGGAGGVLEKRKL